MKGIDARILEYVACNILYKAHASWATHYFVLMPYVGHMEVSVRTHTHTPGTDVGTLFQLRNFINCRNVVTSPSKEINACKDSFVLVVEFHILVAAMTVFQTPLLVDQPDNNALFPEDSSHLEPLQWCNILLLAAVQVLNKHVILSLGDESAQPEECERV